MIKKSFKVKEKINIDSTDVFLFILVIPIYVGLVDAFVYTVAGRTLSDMEWTWQRVLLVIFFLVFRIMAVKARDQARAKKEGAIKDVN
jgi:uncharacterized membrane protein